MASEGSRLVQRGLVLLILLGTLSAAVLTMLLRRPGAASKRPEPRPELLVPLLSLPAAGFPGAFSWGALYQMGEGLPSAPGWEIRYTATRVLAHRGSPRLPLPILREMLDEERQMRNFRARLADGRQVADEAAARQEVLIALKAFGEWHKHSEAVQGVGPDNAEFRQVVQAIEKLSHSENDVVRTRAREMLLVLGF